MPLAGTSVQAQWLTNVAGVATYFQTTPSACVACGTVSGPKSLQVPPVCTHVCVTQSSAPKYMHHTVVYPGCISTNPAQACIKPINGNILACRSCLYGYVTRCIQMPHTESGSTPTSSHKHNGLFMSMSMEISKEALPHLTGSLLHLHQLQLAVGAPQLQAQCSPHSLLAAPLLPAAAAASAAPNNCSLSCCCSGGVKPAAAR